MTNLPEELQAEITSEQVQHVRAFLVQIASKSPDERTFGYEISRAKELADSLPTPVDPDIEEARKIAELWWSAKLGGGIERVALAAIKRGRELERASQQERAA